MPPRTRTSRPRFDPALEREIDAVVAFEHSDPHHVLGPHPKGDGLVVRAWFPGARQVALVTRGASARTMTRRRDEGFFELPIAGPPAPLAYRFEVTAPDGALRAVDDPYAFPPTLGELDLHLIGEGKHERLWTRLGAHPSTQSGVRGVAFAVWAPNARAIGVAGDWNGWSGRAHPMRRLGGGVWELFIPGIDVGATYKFEVRTSEGALVQKADPLAFAAEAPPRTASVVHDLERFTWGDDAWLESRRAADPLRSPMSIYEVHLGSWRRVPHEGNRSLGYREIAHDLATYALEMGFTHVELLPVAEYPFGGSWGYQTGAYFAPTARWGTPDDFRWFVDHLHSRGIGVIVDWVPAHFPRDSHALGRFDGTALYEHLDPRLGEHPDWGTFVFNFGRNEVRNFLIASALFWLDEYHVDGLRVDAVASMLYLDYSRKAGEWVPNAFGGHENLAAITFLRALSETLHREHPGTVLIAEESTSWPAVSRPTYVGGLGFDFKWNMGWMHDTLEYFSKDPIYRRYHHKCLTFGFLYAWSENYILPLSHDEVVHLKRSLIDKMPGDRWQKFANLRSLYAYMWAHPGKKMLFMGGEIGQWREWNHDGSLDWDLLAAADHRGLLLLLRDLNRIYRVEPALWEKDVEPAGFRWIDANASDDNVACFVRYGADATRPLVFVGNFANAVRRDYRIGMPWAGEWREILNTDSAVYGGSDVGNGGVVHALPTGSHGFPASATLTLPPLGAVWLSPALGRPE
ncbi:MAG: 1,4-alpha-glucan branching protein GlgB [Planctomycetes bacterium]|nr:1,4-alpha-glucan branching protein GlgB [Planctomycetota bacterium]MBI3845482.1 1,4-alpha-glucan branching protein GlgB [Planctomycetota bacterium]